MAGEVAGTKSLIQKEPSTTTLLQRCEITAATTPNPRSQAELTGDTPLMCGLPNKTLKDLPQELLLEIVEWLGYMPVDSYRKTLYNLCLVHPFNPAGYADAIWRTNATSQQPPLAAHGIGEA